MLTGDKNEVDMNLALEYCVAEGALEHFLFKLADSEAVVRAAAECCIRRVVGEMYLNDVLTTDRKNIERRITAGLQQLLDTYETGIRITAVHLHDVHPPIEVVPAFRRVATAREDKVTQINRAVGYQKAMIPKARGGAEYILADANAYWTEKKRNAHGDAAYFSALAEAFREAPEAASFLMYMDTIEEVLPPLRKVFLSEEVSRQASKTPLRSHFMMGEFMKRALDGLLGIAGRRME